MPDPPLNVRDDLPGIALVPAPIELLGHVAELDDEIAGEVLGLGFPALLPPEPKQGSFIRAHDDTRIRAANETPPMSCIHVFAGHPSLPFWDRAVLRAHADPQGHPAISRGPHTCRVAARRPVSLERV